jgi:hypothetical protein
MSFLFKFIDSGFLLTLGLVLLISGGIMLYCYRRLNLLEKSLIEHGKILQNFIINYNMQMQHFSLVNNSLHSSKNKSNTTTNDETNRTEYVEFDKIKKINLGEKIAVSDDEDDDDEDNDDEEHEDDDKDDKEDEHDDDDEDEQDDDDEDDEDDDDEDDEDDDDEDDENIEDDEDKKKSKINVKKDNLDNLAISNNKLVENLEDVTDLTDLENIELDEPNISNSDDETFFNNLPINLTSFTLETNNNQKIINLETVENSNDKTGERRNYSKMKVDDLKSLVVTKNLTDNETAQKMKKSDLVKLLQN